MGEIKGEKNENKKKITSNEGKNNKTKQKIKKIKKKYISYPSGWRPKRLKKQEAGTSVNSKNSIKMIVYQIKPYNKQIMHNKHNNIPYPKHSKTQLLHTQKKHKKA